MRYAKNFFELQLRFASHFATLTGQPLAKILLSHSNFYIRFAAGRKFDPEHPVWQAYLAGLPQDEKLETCLAWTWHYYQSRSGENAGPDLIAKAGCFSLSPDGDHAVRMHFTHADSSRSSLGVAWLPERRAELTSLFRSLSQQYPHISQVTGMSWLYNLRAYRRLFPESYIDSAQAVAARYHSMTLWGQFLNRQGEVKPELAEAFCSRLTAIKAPAELANCFPFQVLKVSAPLEAFLQLYGIEHQS